MQDAVPAVMLFASIPGDGTRIKKIGWVGILVVIVGGTMSFSRVIIG